MCCTKEHDMVQKSSLSIVGLKVFYKFSENNPWIGKETEDLIKANPLINLDRS